MDRLCAVAVTLLVASLPANVLAQSADARAGVFLKERVYAELSSSQALSNIYGYVKDTRGWEPADYHVAVAKGRRVPVVYVITHLAATKDVLIRGGAAIDGERAAGAILELGHHAQDVGVVALPG